MADFKILKKEGYQELEGVEEAVKDGSLKIEDLWSMIGMGETDEAAILLFEAGLDVVGEEEEGTNVEDVTDIVLISLPDDILGEHYRIWMKLR
jgi:hypothetical protein